MPTYISGDTGVSQVHDGTVSLNKLAPNSVNSSKVVDGSIQAEDLATPPANPALVPKAWVNFDCTRNASGGVDSANTNRFIRASYGVASVLKNSTGDYTVTFSTPMANANYAVLGMAAQPSAAATTTSVMIKYGTTPTTSSFVLNMVYGGVGYSDPAIVSLCILGN